MVRFETDHRAARAALTHLGEPADPLLGALVYTVGSCEVVAAIQSGSLPAAASQYLDPVQEARASRMVSRWQARLTALPPWFGPGTYHELGIHLVCPGDPGWPVQLGDLGPAAPYALWVRGDADLRPVCQRSVAVAGARAATAYGRTICTQIAAGLSADGWTIISGGAYGIDACAHTTALTWRADGRGARLRAGPGLPARA